MQNTLNIQQIISGGNSFLINLVSELSDLGITTSNLKIDHLCFRVKTSESYQSYQFLFSIHGELLTETLVNGRSISTYRLHEPFRTKNHVVELIELPAPKIGTNYSEGFEHAEFIIKESFDLFATKYPKLNFTKSGQQNTNPELCLKIKNGQAKFHYTPLDRIIEIEQAQFSDIIFDLDGTLIQSREKIYQINSIVFSEALDRQISLVESKEKFQSEFVKLFEAFELYCPFKRTQAISRWSEISKTFSYQMFPGIADFVKKIRATNCRLHLWTARDENSARRILQDCGIESLFTTFSFTTIKNSKPNINNLNFDWQSTNKNSIVVIGDSPTDMIAANHISAVSVAALWDPHANQHEMISSGAQVFINNISELEHWLHGKMRGSK